MKKYILIFLLCASLAYAGDRQLKRASAQTSSGTVTVTLPGDTNRVSYLSSVVSTFAGIETNTFTVNHIIGTVTNVIADSTLVTGRTTTVIFPEPILIKGGESIVFANSDTAQESDIFYSFIQE